MLHVVLLTMALVTSQTLKMEVSDTVEEYLSQLSLTPTRYAIVVSEHVPEGAAVLYWMNASGGDTAVFFFERGFLLRLSRQERRVLIAHEVAHLAPECQPFWTRISREICADLVSSKLVPVNDIEGMLSKSIRMFPYYPALLEFVYRLGAIQGTVPPTESPPENDWLDCH